MSQKTKRKASATPVRRTVKKATTRTTSKTTRTVAPTPSTTASRKVVVTSTPAAKATTRKASTVRVISNCTNILNTAIKNGKSLRATCLSLGFGKNYVSEIRITLNARIADGRFTKKQAAEFTRLYKAYQKAFKAA